MRVKEAYAFAIANGLAAEVEAIRNTPSHPLSRDRYDIFRKGLLIQLFERHGLLERFIAERWPIGATEVGHRKRATYEKRRQENAWLWDNRPPIPTRLPAGGEAELRNRLSQHLDRIEAGLQLFNEGGKDGVEYLIDAGHGRIDILALDAKGAPVVIELKLRRGRRQTLGQLLHYMGWVDQHLGRGTSRGVIVAAVVTTELILAARRATGVALFKYEFDDDVTVTPVLTSGNPKE